MYFPQCVSSATFWLTKVVATKLICRSIKYQSTVGVSSGGHRCCFAKQAAAIAREAASPVILEPAEYCLVDSVKLYGLSTAEPPAVGPCSGSISAQAEGGVPYGRPEAECVIHATARSRRATPVAVPSARDALCEEANV